MSLAPSVTRTDSKAAGSAWRAYLPGVAGLAYVVAWVAGLAIWPANLALNATAGQVAASYRAHPAQAVAQYLLIEGLAGVLLGIVLACVLRAARDRAGRWAAGPAALSAIAVLTSLSQCVIGLFITAAATAGRTARCGQLSDLVNRLDGVKMLALAAAAAWLAVTVTVLPRWLRALAVPTGPGPDRIRLRLPHPVQRAGLDRLHLRPAPAALGRWRRPRPHRDRAASSADPGPGSCSVLTGAPRQPLPGHLARAEPAPASFGRRPARRGLDRRRHLGIEPAAQVGRPRSSGPFLPARGGAGGPRKPRSGRRGRARPES